MINTVPPGPQPFLRSVPSPFGTGELWRPLTIILDELSLAPSPALLLLRCFAEHKTVAIFSTKVGLNHRVAFFDEPRERLRVDYLHGEEIMESTTVPAPGLEAFISATIDEHGFDEVDTRRGLRLSQAMNGRRYDAVVSASDVLALPGLRAAKVTMTAEEACGLLGLYLRAHSDFTIRTGPGVTKRLDFGRFYNGAGGALIPGWVHHRELNEMRFWDDSVLEPRQLINALAARLGRVLVARDHIQVRSTHWDVQRFHGEIRYFFESLVVSLTAVLDVLARYLHVIWALPGRLRDAGFNKTQWARSVREHPVESVRHWGIDLLQTENALVRQHRLIGTLRNLIHSDVPDHMVSFTEPAPQSASWHGALLALHGPDALKLQELSQGDHELWGLHFESPAVALVDLQRFQRTALLFVIKTAGDALTVLPFPDLNATRRTRVAEIRQAAPPIAATYRNELQLLTAVRSEVRYQASPRNPAGYPG